MRTAPALVIGYGSALHSDDAAGLHLAERIAARAYPNVRPHRHAASARAC